MFRSTLLLSALACMLAVGVQAEEVYVRVAPPRAIVETRPARPAAGYIWTPGYHRWDGHAHVWVAGAWVQPPRPHAVWVPHKWVHRHDGYVLVEGHWR
jgi:WXXGXW repeat (2 copies)